VLVAMGVFHQWWLHCTNDGCVTPVVVVELSVVSLGQTYSMAMTRQSLLYLNVYLRSCGHVSNGHMSTCCTCCNPRLQWQLKLKLPNHYSDNPYNLEEIHKAVKFILASRGRLQGG
jgi:hypothetical protein